MQGSICPVKAGYGSIKYCGVYGGGDARYCAVSETIIKIFVNILIVLSCYWAAKYAGRRVWI